MRNAMLLVAMLSVNPICPISTRPAYFGTRRIAPAAATSRFQAWRARPAVEELRPARRSSSLPGETSPSSTRFLAPFVAHVLGQFEHADIDPRAASRSYAAADALGGAIPSIVVASL